MDTLHAIHTRRTIHQYEDTVVPPNVIEQCIEAAHQAPNHKLTWPWGFVVVGPETRMRLCEMALEMRKSTKGLNESAEQFIRRKFLNPGGLVIVTQKKNATTSFKNAKTTPRRLVRFKTLCWPLTLSAMAPSGQQEPLPDCQKAMCFLR